MENTIRNHWTLKGDVVHIVIRRNNGDTYTAKCDLKDFHRVVRRHRSWRILRGRGNCLYAATTTRDSTDTMHRLILGDIPKGQQVCFKNGDGLDCRRENLIVTTRVELSQRVFQKAKSYTGHRNIYPHCHPGFYQVSIIIRQKRFCAVKRSIKEAVAYRDTIYAQNGIQDVDGKRLLVSHQ